MYQTEFKTYKFYEKHGKRLAIYGRVDGNVMQIVVFEVSPLDRFEKAESDRAYEAFMRGQAIREGRKIIVKTGEKDYKPLIYAIPIKDRKKPRRTFLDFCTGNYYIKTTYSYFSLVETIVEALTKWEQKEKY